MKKARTMPNFKPLPSAGLFISRPELDALLGTAVAFLTNCSPEQRHHPAIMPLVSGADKLRRMIGMSDVDYAALLSDGLADSDISDALPN